MRNRIGNTSVLRRYWVGARVGARAAGTVAAAIAVLAGCAVAPERPTFRDQSAPIGVTSRYSDARFAGVWHVRGAFAVDADLVTVQRQGSAPDATVWRLVSRQCPPDGRCAEMTTLWPAAVDLPGADRLRNLAVGPAGEPKGGPERRAVVLWVDAGFRTAAVGDPAGRFAWVLDRKPDGGADRIEAARQVLAFSGFDLSTMEMRP